MDWTQITVNLYFKEINFHNIQIYIAFFCLLEKYLFLNIERQFEWMRNDELFLPNELNLFGTNIKDGWYCTDCFRITFIKFLKVRDLVNKQLLFISLDPKMF